MPPPNSRLPLIIAHRGASTRAPENTLAAFAFAWEEGADAIEGDFHLTRDREIVCHHDPATGQIFEGNYSIRSFGLKELQTLALKTKALPEIAPLHIPSLAEFLRSVPAHREAFLELKTGPEIVPFLLKGIASGATRSDQLTLIAFSSKTVRAVRALAPAMKVNWLVSLEPRGLFRRVPESAQIVARAKCLGVHGVGLSASQIVDASFLAPFYEAGLSVHIWTVDDPDEARRYATLGVGSITTNRPAFIRKAIEQNQ